MTLGLVELRERAGRPFYEHINIIETRKSLEVQSLITLCFVEPKHKVISDCTSMQL